MIEATADTEYEPSERPGESAPWLNLLRDAEKAFEEYQNKADNIDKQYAELKRLAAVSREREFQLFWANVQVLGPSIYARPPVPVVTPKFKDRRRLYQTASELLERVSIVSFDLSNIDETMRLIRDDLAIQARGVAWVRYETKGDKKGYSDKVCYEHVDRKDFLHDPARKWSEVGWVAKRGYLTEDEFEDRFGEDLAKRAAFNIQKDDKKRGAANAVEKAEVWEIWSKTENKVVWVTEGIEQTLDEVPPHLKLDGFFPCPKPAYATTQRRSLIPVPDMLYYKDQLEEVNELTARIHALSEAIKVKGFYPGGGEIGEAIEAAVQINDNRKMMVPISNWAAFGSGGDTIIWLPIDIISTTVAQLVELRRQVIDDVYQIMGLSDIMRGSTEKDETATAQNLKAQYGSVRIRDKQAELVRIARDMVRIGAEIMAEEFDEKTLIEMAQMEIPSEQDIAKQVAGIEKQAEQEFQQKLQEALADPKMVEQAQANPQQAEQMAQKVQQEIVQKAQQQIAKLGETPTREQVMKFLKDEKTRPFVLDIETDSTIQPDEQAEKEARTEFTTALGGTMQQFAPLIGVPGFAPLVGEILKFALAPFRAGRELEGKIDEAVEQMSAMASQPQPNPEAEKAHAEMQMKQQELQAKQQIEQAKMAADAKAQEQDAQFKAQENEAKMAMLQAQMERDRQKGELEMAKLQMELQAKEAELQIKRESAQIDAQAKQQQAAIQTSSAVQQAEIKNRQAEQQAQHNEQAFAQKSALNEQAAAMKGQANGQG